MAFGVRVFAVPLVVGVFHLQLQGSRGVCGVVRQTFLSLNP